MTAATGADAFGDLELDHIVGAVTAGRTEYGLDPLFRTALRSAAAVGWRDEVVRDLEKVEVARCVRRFAARMVALRTCLGQAEKLHHELQRQRWLLSAVENYCAAVTELTAGLVEAAPASRALVALRKYSRQYADSAAFQDLLASSNELAAALAGVRYQL